MFRGAIREPEQVLVAYEDFKKAFKAVGEALPTAELCSQNGIDFVPMVVEAHGGGWGPAARRVLDMVAKHGSAITSDEPEEISLTIAQRLSCSLQRESARAVMRRLHHADAEAFETPLPLWQ